MKTLELTDNEMVYLNLSNRQFLRYTNSYFKHKIYLTYTVVCIAVIFLFCLIKECVGGGRMRFYCYRYQLPNDYSYLNSQELSS